MEVFYSTKGHNFGGDKLFFKYAVRGLGIDKHLFKATSLCQLKKKHK